MQALQLKVLGDFTLRDGSGAEIPIRSRKLRGLLAYLAVQPDRPHERATLATLLWGDRFEAQARQSLRQALLSLRKHLGAHAPQVLQSDDATVRVNAAAIEVDALAFERCARDGELDTAAACYPGPLLDGLDVVSEPFEAWRDGERSRLHELAADVREARVSGLLREGQPEDALFAARDLLAFAPMREAAHRLFMQACAHTGRRAEALAQYSRLCDLLRREYAAAPSAETRELHSTIRHADPLAAPGAAAPAPSPGAAAAASPAARPIGDRPSIAVMPFDDLSAVPGHEYFADGISEDVVAGLSRSGMFYVTSRSSTFAYKGTRANLQQVAAELGVQYVVEGSVRRYGDRARITAQLIDAATDRHVWSERYDRQAADVLGLQDEIVRSMVGSIAPELLSAEIYRVRRSEARHFGAWDNYMRAYWHLSRFNPSDHNEALDYCAKAIELDPQGAGPHGLFAVLIVIGGLYDWGPSRAEAMRQARASARLAVALDDHDPRAQRALGLVDMYERQSAEAMRAFEEAISLDPFEAENHGLLGSACAFAGDYPAARRHIEHALELSPRDVFMVTWLSNLAMGAVAAGHDRDGFELARMAAQQSPDFPGAQRSFASAAGHLGHLAEAREACDRLRRLLPDLSIGQLRERLPLAEPEGLERYLDGLKKAGLPEARHAR